MHDIESYEDALVTQLGLFYTAPNNPTIIKTPETDAGFEVIGLTNGRLIVGFIDLDPIDKDSTSVDMIMQDCNAYFCVTIESAKLYGQNGIFDHYKKAKLALLGWNCLDLQKFSFSKFCFNQRVDGVFMYDFIVKAKTCVVGQYEPPTPGAPLVQVTPNFN